MAELAFAPHRDRSRDLLPEYYVYERLPGWGEPDCHSFEQVLRKILQLRQLYAIVYRCFGSHPRLKIVSDWTIEMTWRTDPTLSLHLPEKPPPHPSSPW